MEKESYEIVRFENEGISLDVNVSPKEGTVWLNREQMAILFDRDTKTISKHINNVLSEECKGSTVSKIATVQKEGEREVKRIIEYFDFDVILSVGYRVKSKNGIIFRRWANSVLKQYLLKGYVINEDRLTL